jgi:DNA ligase-1
MQVQEFPQLYALASTGKVKTWKIKVCDCADGTADIITEFGQLNGKLQTKIEHIRTGKNIGKANETTPWEQAVSEATSDYQKKLDKKYITEIPTEVNEPDILLPMLAHDYRKRSHDIVYPAYVQPKLNGIRCLAKKINATTVQFTSRKNKNFPEEVTAHLVDPLLNIMETGEIFDGEFYVHDWPFQLVSQTVKKARPWKEDLQLHVFDIADNNVVFDDRRTELIGRLTALNNFLKVKLVPTPQIADDRWVKIYHDTFVKQGYEGIIVRNFAGLYLFDHRSKDLQKYKEFIDEEFEIVDAEYEVLTDPATGLESFAAVFVCVNEDGNRFNVRPRGTVTQRVKWYENRSELFGKHLTVRYQERSVPSKDVPGNIPIFPVGITVRDYE